MKLTVDTKQLSDALKKAKLTISPSDPSNALLQNFAVRAEGNRFTIVATDLQLATVCDIPAAVDEEGATTLPGMKFCQIVDNSSADELSISLGDKGHSANIVSGRYQGTLATLPFDDYPKVEDFSEERAVKTKRAELLTKLNRISFSVADNEAKKNLLAVYINAGFMQASDGAVTSVIEFDPNFTDVLIQALAVKDLIHILRSSEADEVAVCATDNFLLFKLGDDLFMTRLSTAKFPDIPKKIVEPTEENDIVFSVDRAKLKAAVNRIGITANEKTLSIGFFLAQSSDGTSTLNLSSSDNLGNKASEVLEVGYKGPELKLFFNYTRIADILTAMKEDATTFRLHENRKVPVRIQEDDPLFMCFLLRLTEQIVVEPTKPAEGDEVDEI